MMVVQLITTRLSLTDIALQCRDDITAPLLCRHNCILLRSSFRYV